MPERGNPGSRIGRVGSRLRRVAAAAVAAAALAGSAAPSAAAQDPGRWLLTGASSVPITYWQGLTSAPGDTDVYFVGIFEGLWRTTPLFAEEAGVGSAIPAAVKQREGYNHIGDPTWSAGDGGRVLLPLECFVPGVGNTCGTGSIGVADPATLAFEYYVKLDPAEIQKAMWAETSPDGSLLWTSSGDDLLAYRSAEVAPANAAPGGPALEAARRVAGAVPPSGVTGAVFRDERLLLAGQDGGRHQVWAVDPATGERRLEIELDICGESEGLDLIDTLGGELHWLIAPFEPGCELSFGPSSALLHFAPAPAHRRLDVDVIEVTGSVPGSVTATVAARRHGRPLSNARVGFAGATGRTSKDGTAVVTATLARPGRFAALARKGQNYGLSELAEVGLPATGARTAPRTGAG